jgi:hypothetical protein
MEGPARMSRQPLSDLRMLVGGVVVDHRLDQLAGRNVALDGIEETDELLVPVALHAAPDHAAVEHVEGGEQCRGAVALVIVRHGAAAAGFQRQPRLCAVQRLDLAFLVDRQHHRVRRRIKVEADDVDEFVGEPRVARAFEAAHAMRLLCVPDALHRAHPMLKCPHPEPLPELIRNPEIQGHRGSFYFRHVSGVLIYFIFILSASIGILHRRHPDDLCVAFWKKYKIASI